MEKMVKVCLYCDTTGLFNEDEIEKDNLCELRFPEKLVKDWYYSNLVEFEEETSGELGMPTEFCTFDLWFNDVYTADDMDGFYAFCVNNGFKATREVA
jgi:hypothetical protein